MGEQEYTVTCEKCNNVLYYMALECVESLVDCPECGAEYVCVENMIMSGPFFPEK